MIDDLFIRIFHQRIMRNERTMMGVSERRNGEIISKMKKIPSWMYLNNCGGDGVSKCF